MVSKIFCELDFEDAEDARLHRNQRILALQTQGVFCTAKNLYRVDEKQVYLLTAEVVSTQWQKEEDNIRCLKDENSHLTHFRTKFEAR